MYLRTGITPDTGVFSGGIFSGRGGSQRFVVQNKDTSPDRLNWNSAFTNIQHSIFIARETPRGNLPEKPLEKPPEKPPERGRVFSVLLYKMRRTPSPEEIAPGNHPEKTWEPPPKKLEFLEQNGPKAVEASFRDV